MKEEIQSVAFQMIAQVGMAKSMYIEALQVAKTGDFEKAKEMMNDADNEYVKAHHMHFDVVQQEAKGEDVIYSVLFMHAEDQLLNTETIKILCSELIEMYEILLKNN